MHTGREAWHMLLFLWHYRLAPCSPTASVWLAVSAHGCVCEHYDGGVGAGGGVPLCPTPGFVSPFPA